MSYPSTIPTPPMPPSEEHEDLENPHDPSVPYTGDHPTGIDPEPEPNDDVKTPGTGPFEEPIKDQPPNPNTAGDAKRPNTFL